MKLGLESLAAFRSIQIISGRPPKGLMELLEDVGIYAILSYIQNKNIVIPYIGNVSISSGDAGIRCEFSPSPFLVRNIGQIQNGEDADFESKLAQKFKEVLMPKREPKKYKKEKIPKAVMVEEAQEGLL